MLYDCSVVVCTYRPTWDKLRLTLKSILMQENCNFQIVITDDGSEDNAFDKVREYFAVQSFSNYKLIANLKNCGTVENILHGLEVCDGEFVKPISPGDFLHGRQALSMWVDFMRAHEEYVMSYCDAIYYHMKEKQIIPLQENAHPQSREPNAKSYIVYGDLCLGASTMVRRQPWLRYLKMLKGKVIYAEDFSYQLMLYCGENIINVSGSFLLYEFGTGISTNGSDFWRDKLREDSLGIKKILLSVKPGDKVKSFKIEKYLQIPQNNSLRSRWKRVKYCPMKILFRLKRKVFPRKTSMDIDNCFVEMLLK